MTSEEKLVAQVAKELLESNARVETTGQIALGTDQENLTLPCTIVSASMSSEEAGSALPKEYELTLELRSVSRVHDEAAIDEVFRQIGVALDTAPATWPAVLTQNFAWFRIEEQTGSGATAGDTPERSRVYRVFAKLF